MSLLEIACFTPDAAILAYNAGADRIELCANREAGGTTPPREWLIHVKRHVTIPVFVMIRPRGGNFSYSKAEFEDMKLRIDQFAGSADGYVFGILDNDHNVDIARTAELVRRAHPLPCTFHRAFDDSEDPFQALEDIVSTGCNAILTSGGAVSAISGVKVLQQLVKRAGTRIAIMPGGGVRAKSLSEIQDMTNALIYHSSAVVKGHSRPDHHEIGVMKAILQRPSADVIVDEDVSPIDIESNSDMYLSAVSVGTVTPAA